MKRSVRFKKILELLEKDLEKAKQIFASLQQDLIKANLQVSQINNYREQYTNDLTNMAKQGISAQKYFHYQEFLQQIDLAAKKQHEKIIKKKEELKEAKLAWEKEYMKCQKYHKLINKYKNQEMITQNKKEQKQIDDMITVRYKTI